MLKNITRLEHIASDKVFHFLCDMDSPVELVKNALRSFMEYVDQYEKAALEKMKDQELNQQPEEIDKPLDEVLND